MGGLGGFAGGGVLLRGGGVWEVRGWDGFWSVMWGRVGRRVVGGGVEWGSGEIDGEGLGVCEGSGEREGC